MDGSRDDDLGNKTMDRALDYATQTSGTRLLTRRSQLLRSGTGSQTDKTISFFCYLSLGVCPE